MKKFTFTQHIPLSVRGQIEPKSYDFDDFNELVNTPLFQKFHGKEFMKEGKELFIVGNNTKRIFGYITENTSEYSNQRSPIITENAFGWEPPKRNHKQKPMSGSELDLIENILSQPHITITDRDMEDQANFIGDGGVEDERTPEQKLGLL